MLDWDRDGRDWPHRTASSFLAAGGGTWHVQQMGEGPVALLLHGTGAATHSWRHVAPLLAASHRVVAIDLPGHGFTRVGRAASLPRMARAVAALLATLEIRPALVVGHSAGAALMIRIVLDGLAAPRAMASVNGALLPFRGLAGLLFPPMARLLAASPAPQAFAWGASGRGAVERLIASTGSDIDLEGCALYARLIGDPGHVAGTLAMMADWDLASLERDLPRLATPLLLIAASDDRTVPPGEAVALRERIPGSKLLYLRRAGHLAHEERAGEVAAAVLAFASDCSGQ